MKLTLSIIVPIYNVGEYLRETLKSVADLPDRDVEILLVDDCSTDDSLQICEEFRTQDRRIRLLGTQRNSGVSAARNLGLANASGKFVFFLDADDCIRASALSDCLGVLRSGRVPDLVVFRFESAGKELSNDQLFTDDVINSDLPDSLLKKLISCEYQPEQCWSFLIRRSFLESTKLLFADVKIAEDQEFVAKLLCSITSVSYYPRLIYWYRERPGSLKKSNDLAATKSLLRVIKSLYAFKDSACLDSLRSSFIVKRINEISAAFFARLALTKSTEITRLDAEIDSSDLDVLYMILASKNLPPTGSDASLQTLEKIRQICTHQFFKNIEAFCLSGEVSVYCTGPTGRATIHLLLENGIPVKQCFDDNAFLWGSSVEEVHVENPEKISEVGLSEAQNFRVLIAVPKADIARAIARRLQRLGLHSRNFLHVSFENLFVAPHTAKVTKGLNVQGPPIKPVARGAID